ncbi:hypothetical protein BDZ89DRAFT_452909 [Hymenopellis radicata]|nr:hypothetical protein BDZ89DRAFT_452909 [Hymenopellis radicata]
MKTTTVQNYKLRRLYAVIKERSRPLVYTRWYTPWSPPGLRFARARIPTSPLRRRDARISIAGWPRIHRRQKGR